MNVTSSSMARVWWNVRMEAGGRLKCGHLVAAGQSVRVCGGVTCCSAHCVDRRGSLLLPLVVSSNHLMVWSAT